MNTRAAFVLAAIALLASCGRNPGGGKTVRGDAAPGVVVELQIDGMRRINGAL